MAEDRLIDEVERRAAGAAAAVAQRVTVKELSDMLLFSPQDGFIHLGGHRMLLLHSASFGALKREMIEGLGRSAARGILMRVGFAAGTADAALVRREWPAADGGSTLTAGERLHAVTGMVRVDTLRYKKDVAKGIFDAEFLWHGSLEAGEHLSSFGLSHHPVCWMQIGYASGYASASLGKLVVFRETECAACGAPHCRVIGATADKFDCDSEELSSFNPDMFTPRPPGKEQPKAAAPAASLRPAIASDPGMVGVSAAFSVARQKIDRVASTKAPVLLIGESGVGKELFAKALHRLSSRARRPFVAVNCAALPESLVEAELFGVERGAYTGASASRMGRFERASGGTLFLDEINSLSPEAQGKMLRALEDGQIERVGGSRPIDIDLRVVAATNRNLAQEVALGRFRDDLYYRLNVYPVLLPPLRDRRDDIPLLIEHFRKRFSEYYGKPWIGFKQSTIEALLNYDYPGNVRELQNLIERGVIGAVEGRPIDVEDLFEERLHRWPASMEAPAPRRLMIGESARFGEPRPPLSLDQQEKAMLQQALTAARGNVAKAARAVGLTRPRFAYRAKKFGVAYPRPDALPVDEDGTTRFAYAELSS